LLGGGCNTGFSLEVFSFDPEKLSFSSLPGMSQGRDLRNKAVIYDNCVYAVGGNNFTAEKLDLVNKTWIEVPSYKDYVINNLDSWSCALTF
jgi:hypothetical protein